MPTTPAVRYDIAKLEPRVSAPGAIVELPIKLAPSTNFPQGAILGEIVPTYTLTITATGGTFTLSVTLAENTTYTTAAIAYNASAATMQTALRLIWPGASVSGTGPYTITPPGGAFSNPAVGTGSLTGGSATLAVANTNVNTYGVFNLYNSSHTDGSAIPKCILPYSCQTDSSGNITFSPTSGQAGGEFGQTYLTVDAYFSGWFNTQDLLQSGTGAIDANCLSTSDNGYPFFLRRGTLINGVLQLV